VRAVLPLLIGASFAIAPSSALALTNAERKAMDAKASDAASSRNSAFAEVRFGGPVGDLLGKGDLRNGSVKVRFIPTAGKATTITERGPSRAPTTRRRGSKGDFDVARDGRRLLFFVKNLPAPAARVVVTTKAPPKLDTLRTQVPFLDEEAELELELERIDRKGVAAQTRQSNAELTASDTSTRVRRLERALDRADSRAQARKVRKKLRKQRAKLRRQRKLQARSADRLGVLDAWIAALEADLRGPATRQCDDRGDNDGDSLVDFGFDKDPGCVMRLDDDEVDVAMPLTCPSPGGSASVTGTIPVAADKTLERYVISLPPQAPDEPRLAIVDAPVDGQSGGPYPLETGVTQLCNYEFDFVYSYVFSGGSLRVTVSAQNNGGFAGGGQLQMRLAAGTSR
jgi:hypothetical protein